MDASSENRPGVFNSLVRRLFPKRPESKDPKPPANAGGQPTPENQPQVGPTSSEMPPASTASGTNGNVEGMTNKPQTPEEPQT